MMGEKKTPKLLGRSDVDYHMGRKCDGGLMRRDVKKILKADFFLSVKL